MGGGGLEPFGGGPSGQSSPQPSVGGLNATCRGEAEESLSLSAKVGWAVVAKRAAEATAQSAELRGRFFSARLNLAACRLTQAGKSEQSRDKLLGMAESDIRLTYKLYPDLGGEASRRQFDRLLKEIQRARGVASPQGLPALEAATATAQ